MKHMYMYVCLRVGRMYMYQTLDDLYSPLTSLISLYTLHCTCGAFKEGEMMSSQVDNSSTCMHAFLRRLYQSSTDGHCNCDKSTHF